MTVSVYPSLNLLLQGFLSSSRCGAHLFVTRVKSSNTEVIDDPRYIFSKAVAASRWPLAWPDEVRKK